MIRKYTLILILYILFGSVIPDRGRINIYAFLSTLLATHHRIEINTPPISFFFDYWNGQPS